MDITIHSNLNITNFEIVNFTIYIDSEKKGLTDLFAVSRHALKLCHILKLLNDNSIKSNYQWKTKRYFNSKKIFSFRWWWGDRLVGKFLQYRFEIGTWDTWQSIGNKRKGQQNSFIHSLNFLTHKLDNENLTFSKNGLRNC